MRAAKFIQLIFILVCIGFTSCKKDFVANETSASTNTFQNIIQSTRPNIILFIADDFGYEIPTFTGGQSYNTPNLDFMAANGIQFTECYSHPDGYPSRLAVYTGKCMLTMYKILLTAIQ